MPLPKVDTCKGPLSTKPEVRAKRVTELVKSSFSKMSSVDKRAMLASRNKRRKLSVENSSSGAVTKRMKITYSDSKESSEDENDFVSVKSEYSNSHKTVVNLIDRVMDFKTYKVDTSLDCLCRDWARATEKLNTAIEAYQAPCKTATDAELPRPTEEPGDTGQEIAKLNETIRVKVRSSEKSDLDLIKVLSVDEATEIHALLKLHVNRWKSSRKEWLRYYESANARYQDARQKLKTIFEGI